MNTVPDDQDSYQDDASNIIFIVYFHQIFSLFFRASLTRVLHDERGGIMIRYGGQFHIHTVWLEYYCSDAAVSRHACQLRLRYVCGLTVDWHFTAFGS